MLLHQLMLMCVSSGQPSLRNFNEKSVIVAQLSKFSFCNLGQCLDNAKHVVSVSFLQSFKLRSSMFGHIWASVLIDPSAMDWQPRSDNWRRKPTHLRDIFSMIGPWKRNKTKFRWNQIKLNYWVPNTNNLQCSSKCLNKRTNVNAVILVKALYRTRKIDDLNCNVRCMYVMQLQFSTVLVISTWLFNLLT